MSSEEKSAWVMGVVAVCGYVVYLVVILGAGGQPSEVDYVPAMLWTIGGAIVVSILARIVWGMFTPGGEGKKDQRDREIYQFSERIGQSFLVIGGVAAMLLAMFELGYFWIANVLYLCFVISAILSCTVRIIAYRRGFQSW
ncbi:hypothetical protein [Microterricola viridarii]|nr:hypothetical protein [Microterricola viridarii]